MNQNLFCTSVRCLKGKYSLENLNQVYKPILVKSRKTIFLKQVKEVNKTSKIINKNNKTKDAKLCSLNSEPPILFNQRYDNTSTVFSTWLREFLSSNHDLLQYNLCTINLSRIFIHETDQLNRYLQSPNINISISTFTPYHSKPRRNYELFGWCVHCFIYDRMQATESRHHVIQDTPNWPGQKSSQNL